MIILTDTKNMIHLKSEINWWEKVIYIIHIIRVILRINRKIKHLAQNEKIYTNEEYLLNKYL